ncbi:MAG: DUF3047 domain-containing protein [Nitrospirota bacterium]
MIRLLRGLFSPEFRTMTGMRVEGQMKYMINITGRSAFMVLFMLFLVSAAPIQVNGEEILLRDNFNDLDNWKPLYFSGIKEHTKYSIESDEGNSFLKAESRASASGIVNNREFNVYDFPRLRWRWKISNTYKKGDAEEKSGDDYPLRVYILFKYDPETASLGRKIRYALAKTIYGEYPPHSSLNYIWANRKHGRNIISNAYASEVKMIPLQTGNENSGKWIEQDINIIRDYRAAFGEDPPLTGRLAIMSDSDNTGESAVSYIDYIEVFR